MATKTWITQIPQHRTSVVSIDQTWLGYHAGIEWLSWVSFIDYCLRDELGSFLGFGVLRKFCTVEDDMKILSNPSWLAIRIRPIPTLFYALFQTNVATSDGVLFAGMYNWASSSILCSHR